MNKLKMMALTAMAAATLGTGALAAAPSASAKPDCGYLLNKYRNTMLVAGNRMARGEWESASIWLRTANEAARLYSANC